jgi:hypothetical protein
LAGTNCGFAAAEGGRRNAMRDMQQKTPECNAASNVEKDK